MHRLHPEHRDFARKLRGLSTDAERLMWSRLRGRQLNGAKFRRQHPLGLYVLDFVCLEAGLVIEVDGSQHADSADDAERDAWLAFQGLHVLRFWNNDVMHNMDGVLEVVMQAISVPPPQPSTSPLASGSDSPGRRQAAGPVASPGLSPLKGEGA